MSDPTNHPALAPLAEALGGTLPPALLAEPWEVRPLALGVRDALIALLVEHGLSAPEAEHLARRTLARWTHTPAYLLALAADGAWRYDLEGNAVEPVAKEHTLAASMGLLTTALRENAKRAGVPGAPPKPKADKVLAEAPVEVAPTPATAPPRPTLTVKPKPRTP